MLQKARGCSCAKKGKRGKKSGTRNMLDTGLYWLELWVATSAKHACIPERLIEAEVAKSIHSYLYSSSIIIL